MRRRLIPDAQLVGVRSLVTFGSDRCPQLAAAISYHALLSLIPLALVAVSVAGLVADQGSVARAIDTVLFEPLGLAVDTRTQLERQITDALAGAGAVGLFGIVALLWTVSACMGSVRQGVEQALRVQVARRRPFWRAKLLDLGLALVLAAGLGGSLVAGALMQAASDYEALSWALRIGVECSLLLVGSAAFAFSYIVLPSVRPSVGAALVGACTAGVIFEVAKRLLAVWLEHFSHRDAVYGSMGAIASMMLFVFVASNILLLGAKVTHEWSRVRAGDYDAHPDEANERRGLWLLIRNTLFGSD